MLEILANTITADMGLIPGLAIAGPAMGLPLSILASFLERPFISLAGVQHHAIWYSIQANTISLLVGYVGVFAAAFIGEALPRWAPSEPVFTVWPFVAVAVSILVERTYLSIRTSEFHPKWRWIIVGNVLSAGACIGLLMLVTYLREAQPGLQFLLMPYRTTLLVFAAAGSVALIAAAFAKTREPGTGRSAEEPATALRHLT